MGDETPGRAGSAGGILAGLTVFLAWPLSFFGLALVSRAHGLEEDGLAARIGESWIEGGGGMYVVSFAAALAAVAGALALFISTTRGRSAMLVLAPLAGLAALTGAVFSWDSVSQAAAAAVHAHPADRESIMAGSIGETLWSTIFGLISTSALMLAGGLGGVVGAWFRRGKGGFPLWLGSLLLFALALLHAAPVGRLVSVVDVFSFVAHLPPAARPTMLANGIDGSWGASASSAGLTLGLVLFGATLAAGLVATRKTPAVMLLFLSFGVAGLLGMTSIVLGRRMSSSLVHERFAALEAPVARMAFEGPAATALPVFTVKADGVWRESDSWEEPDARLLTGEQLEAAVTEQAANEERMLAVGLGKDAQPAALAELLSRAVRAGVREVELVGTWRTDITGTPPELEPVAWLMRDVPRGAVVAVDTEAARCGEPCVFTAIDAVEASKAEPVLVKANPAISPEALVKAALRAQEKGRPLVLVFAAGDAPSGK